MSPPRRATFVVAAMLPWLFACPAADDDAGGDATDGSSGDETANGDDDATPGDDSPGDDSPGDDSPGDDSPGDDSPGDDTAGDDDPDDDGTGDDDPDDGTDDGPPPAGLPCEMPFDHEGFAGCEGMVEGLPVKFFPLAEGVQVQRVAAFFHGDTANDYLGNWGFRTQILEWAQARDILVLGVLSPATYGDGTVAYGAAQPEHADAVATTIETFLDAYEVEQDTHLFWGVSGGSWFFSASFIAHVGHRLPGVYVANCGGSGNAYGWGWDPETEPEIRDLIPVYFNYGTEDFLADGSHASHLQFEQLGFTSDELVHQGATHCDHPIGEPTIEFWERHVD